MAYLGNVPARSFISFERQVFTIVNSQTAYTLSHSVTNENDIRLVVNNVVQEPGSGKAYTATGTTLTLSAALTNGTDEMYCVFLGRATATNAPGAGSVGTAQLAADSVTLAKMASGTDGNIISYDASGNPVAVATGSAGQILTSAGAGAPPTFATAAAGEANDPSFHAYNPQNGSIASGTDVVVSNNTELLDSSAAYDTSTYKFTPQVAGYYFLYSNVRYQSSTTDFDRINLVITKNGSGILAARNNNKDYSTVCVSGIVQANGSSDYFQMTSYQNSGGSISITTEDEYTYFGGFLIKKS